MEKVSLEVARKDIENWLDEKRISAKKRESLSGMVDNLIDAVAEGNLVKNPDGTLTQNLIFPKEGGVQSLTYKSRITSLDLEPAKRLIKGDSFDDNLTRCIYALTGQTVNVIRGLDLSTDRGLAESIAVFFV